MSYVLACCNNDGICFGFLNNARQVETDERLLDDSRWCDKNLMTFRTKRESNETVMQINFSHLLLHNGYPFRVVAVRR